MKNFRWNRAEQLSFLVLVLSVIALKMVSFKVWSREDRQPSAAAEVAAEVAAITDVAPVTEVVRTTNVVVAERAGVLPETAGNRETVDGDSPNRGERNSAQNERLPAAERTATDRRPVYNGGRTAQGARRAVSPGEAVERRAGSSGGSVEHRVVRIDLNRVDSATLVAVRGIGPYTASRILRYRRQLGGFVRLEQLDEIKGLYPENLTVLKSQALIDTSVIERLSVNASPVEALAAHPYLSWRQARALDGLRRRRGRIRNISDLSFLDEFTAADLARLAPYLQW